jgi:RHS repeat-associated protein
MGTRNFHWDPIDDCVMSETDQSGNAIATYTHEPGDYGPLLSENRSGTESYHHFDALGSTTMLTNDAGTITDTFAYNAWGTTIARTGTTSTSFQWLGQWGYYLDSPTNTYYIRARVYHTVIARWESVDPARFISDRSEPYSYSISNPLLFHDASGLWPMCSTSFCTNTGPLFWVFEGFYGLRVDLIGQVNQCCGGMMLKFTFKENHDVQTRGSRCGEPANSEIGKGDIYPLRFGAMDIGCSAPQQTRQKTKNGCWIITVTWECKIRCAGECTCSGVCLPNWEPIEIYPSRKNWGFGLNFDTTIEYDDDFCVLRGCSLDTSLEWLPLQDVWAIRPQAGNNCNENEQNKLWGE